MRHNRQSTDVGEVIPFSAYYLGAVNELVEVHLEVLKD